MQHRLICTLCPNPETVSDATETARVNSNVRAHTGDQFTVWRCSNCQTIHTCEIVDLAYYYADYPIRGDKDDFVRRIAAGMYRNRLRQNGLKIGDRILDYGSGSGDLMNALRRMGYEVIAYDAYVDGLSDEWRLEPESYDCVLLQDVIEHVEDQPALLEQVVGLLKPGGILALGTPDAESIDLSNPEKYIHSLHPPYHLHLLPRTLVLKMAESAGLELLREYGWITETRFPFINRRFMHHYCTINDNTLDLGYEDFHINPRLFSPKSMFYAFFGSFIPPYDDFFGVFRKR